jgi:hypothetical protein
MKIDDTSRLKESGIGPLRENLSTLSIKVMTSKIGAISKLASIVMTSNKFLKV